MQLQVLEQEITVAVLVEVIPIDGRQRCCIAAVLGAGGRDPQAATTSIESGGAVEELLRVRGEARVQVLLDEVDDAGERLLRTAEVEGVETRRFKVEINDQDSLTLLGEFGGNVDKGQGAAHAALEGVEGSDVHGCGGLDPSADGRRAG